MSPATMFAILLTLAEPLQAAWAQRMAVPAYFYPGPYWTQMAQAGSALRIAVMNPNSGPGSALDPLT